MDAFQHTMVEKNIRLVAFIARRYISSGVLLEDLISIGSVGLVKAAGHFDVGRDVKFATYAAKCIMNEIRMYLRTKQHQNIYNETSIDNPLYIDEDGNEMSWMEVLTSEEVHYTDVEHLNEHAVMHRALEMLPSRDRLIIELRYGLGQEEKTQREIATYLNISQSYVSRLEKTIIAKLRRIVARLECLEMIQ